MPSEGATGGRPRGRAAIDVFNDVMADAEHLLHLAEMLENSRINRMRAELRARVGAALGVPRAQQDRLDCVESADLFIVLKPTGGARREHFGEAELRPLLRQAVVAAAAAVESYVAVKSKEFISSALDEPPARLRDIPLTFGDILELERRYKRRGWGRRNILQQYLEHEASSHPDKIGQVLATVGKRSFWPKVDSKRRVDRGASEMRLRALTDRRNIIAHTGDRSGGGRAPLAPGEVASLITDARSIVTALDLVLMD